MSGPPPQQQQQQQQQQSTRQQSSLSQSAHTNRSARNRQYTHLQSQLSQLNAHLADTENLLAMTAAQAEYLSGLGGWWGGLFISASKVLGEGDLSEPSPAPAPAPAEQRVEEVKGKAKA
ncbi:MAG: hypothetical protein Q9202_002801 [Teloschistes flavicans]